PQREEDALRRREERREPGARGDGPARLAARDPDCGEEPASAPSAQRVPDRQRRVLSRCDDHEQRDADESREPGQHTPKRTDWTELAPGVLAAGPPSRVGGPRPRRRRTGTR